MTALNKQALREAAEKETALNLDTAQVKRGNGGYLECPCCKGAGYVEEENDFCNIDGVALGVQFYGIGEHHGLAELYLRAANPATVLTLLDENYRLTAERDALRENIGGDNTRAAADIYFQLVEECEIPSGGSLVGYVDDIKERLSNAENHSAELDNALCELLPGTQYMDPPDGGSVTPLEQVRRMVSDYLERTDAAEKRIAELGGQKRLIGWRTADYTDETSDPALAKNWAGAVGVLPIFEGDVNTKLSAAGIGVKGE